MGAGSWGTAVGVMCVDVGESTTLWARRDEVADEIRERRTNQAYLPDVELPDQLTATTDPQRALEGADVVVLAVPSVGLEQQLSDWGALIDDRATLVSLVKGVDVASLRFGSQMIVETLDCDPERVVVLSGPNLARECAARMPAAGACSWNATSSAATGVRRYRAAPT
jgi:glycerol-3-phosphate dehydrogenase (NAD(P)+)